MNVLPGLILATLAGLSTLIGSLIAMRLKENAGKWLSVGMGFTAGVMIFLGFVELLGSGIRVVGIGFAMLAFFIGMLIIYLVDIIVPHCYKAEKCDSRLMKVGVMVMLGLIIHNFPEGMAVVLSSTADLSLGLAVAIAIAMHNIPEGIAVSLPIFQATGSKRKAFNAGLLTALAEPLGALVAILFLLPFLNETLIYIMLSAVGGMMVFISFDELLPEAYGHKDRHTIIAGLVGGMALMALSMVLLG
jgi:zinc transporter, ZIP family